MARITTKDKVLELLNANAGKFYSGQELADELGISRTAIWKAVTTLREEGYNIEGSTKLGYAMSADTDIMSSAAIMSSLNDKAKKFYSVEAVKTIDSTNTVVKARGLEGGKEGLCIAAMEQTAGRGRRGRSFYSPDSTGLYMSVLLRPDLSLSDAVLITTAAAVAAAKACDKVKGEALDAINEKLKAEVPKKSDDKNNNDKKLENAGNQDDENGVQIKWVNDLFLNGRKFCGILTEANLSVESNAFEFAVLGIGFNLLVPKGGWPDEIKNIAGSLFEADECPAGTRNRLAAEFLNEFLDIYEKLPDVSYLDEYRARSLAIGRDVDVLEPDGSSRPAHAIGIDDRCQLLVKYEGEDEVYTLNSGEISVKLK